MRRIAFIVALWTLGTPVVWGQSVQERQGTTDNAAKRIKAAENFAKALAPEGTEAYAVAFRKALEAADAALAVLASGSARSLGGGGSGGIEADPRYIKNLKSMVQSGKDKIWGGQPVPPGAFPDAVAVLGGGGICTGTVVAPRAVLTAAHCHFGGVNKKVVLGDDVQQPLATYDVVKSVPWAQTDWRQGDLALLIVDQEIKAQPRRLARAEWIDAAGDVRVVGYGRTENEELEPTGIKRMVDVPVASPNCAGAVSAPTGSKDDAAYYGCGKGMELVAGLPLLERDSCNGDSGGPVYVKGPDNNYYLAAATSRAVSRTGLRACGDGGVYVRVDGAALQWIQQLASEAALGPYKADAAERPAGIRVASLGLPSLPAAFFQDPPVDGLAKARETLARIAPTGTAIGRFERRAESLVFVLAKDANQWFPISNAGDISSALLGLPVNVDFLATAGGVEANMVSLEPVAVWKRTGRAMPPNLSDPIQEAVTKLEAAAKAPASGAAEGLQAVGDSSRELYEQVVFQYMKVPAQNVELRRRLIETFKGARRLNKAVYGRGDIYSPETYRKIFEQSRHSVGLARADRNEPFCSGVLVAKDKVLTARHCLAKGQDELEVWLDFEGGMAPDHVDRYAVQEVVSQGGAAFPDGPDMDFALLLVKPNAAQKLPGDKVAAKCLSAKRVRRGDALYVVGHPEGHPRAVHDNAFVQFPFRATEFERRELELIVESETALSPERQAVMQDFVRSYRCCVDVGTVKLYENYSLRWGQQPTIGADADTYHGNSGSPVFDRRSHRLIGLLIAGESDVAVSRTVGWSAHEAILPTTSIVAALSASLGADWNTQLGVCVDP